VLLAMGLSREQALASLRFSLGEDNTACEMQAAARILEEVVAQLRTF
jgi:cysteine sulfinate desulfinase/cysteine desulfurase-like protein